MFGQDLFVYLKPPGVKLDLLRFDGCAVGDEVHLSLDFFLSTQKWVSVMTSEKHDEKEWSFTDEGQTLPWPLTSWKHQHRVVYLDDKSSKIIDDIHFGCAYSWMEGVIYPMLWTTFAIRPARYKKFFQR